MNDIRVALDPLYDAFGVPATVTRPAPNEEPITTTVIWASQITTDMPGAMDFQRRERRHVMTIRLDEVPTVPRGTLIAAPDRLGGTTRTWRVEGPDQLEDDQVRVVVIPEPEW